MSLPDGSPRWLTQSRPEDAAGSDDKLTITYTATWKDDKNGNDIPDEDDRFTVVYTDGVDDEEVFADQSTGNLTVGTRTPSFTGSLDRTDYVFVGWNPTVKSTVRAEDAASSADKLTITYTATWKDDKNNNDIPDDEEEFTVVYLKGEHGAFEEDVDGETTFAELVLNAPTPAYNGAKDDTKDNKPQGEEDWVFVGLEYEGRRHRGHDRRG